VTSSNSTAYSSAFYCDEKIDDNPEWSCNECHDLAPNACLGTDFGRSWMMNVDSLVKIICKFFD